MTKFTVVAMNLAQSMPKRWKKSVNASMFFLLSGHGKTPGPAHDGLLAQEQRVERDGLGQRHADDADGEDLAERAGITTHRLRCAKARQTDTHSRAQTCEGDGEVT